VGQASKDILNHVLINVQVNDFTSIEEYVMAILNNHRRSWHYQSGHAWSHQS